MWLRPEQQDQQGSQKITITAGSVLLYNSSLVGQWDAVIACEKAEEVWFQAFQIRSSKVSSVEQGGDVTRIVTPPFWLSWIPTDWKRFSQRFSLLGTFYTVFPALFINAQSYSLACCPSYFWSLKIDQCSPPDTWGDFSIGCLDHIWFNLEYSAPIAWTFKLNTCAS